MKQINACLTNFTNRRRVFLLAIAICYLLLSAQTDAWAIGAITGTPFTCAGSTMLLSDTSAGGTWTSSDSSVALPFSPTTSSISVIGLREGTAVITYTLPSSLYSTVTVTVNSSGAITGEDTVCINKQFNLYSMAFFADSIASGGLWEVTLNPGDGIGAFAEADTFGGYATKPGFYVIGYTREGCSDYFNVQVVMPPLDAIDNTIYIDSGAKVPLPVSGSSYWSSYNDAVLHIDYPSSSANTMTGNVAGGARMGLMTELNTCSFTETDSVVVLGASAAMISGPGEVCVGSTATYSCTLTGGTWSSSATINPASGVFSPTVAGIATITYSISSSVYAIKVVSIDAIPTIAMPDSVLFNTTFSALPSPTGGTWDISVNPYSGMYLWSVSEDSAEFLPVFSALYTISYSLNGCTGTHDVRVTPPAPGPISHTFIIDSGASVDITNFEVVWHSYDESIARIDRPSIYTLLTGVTPGTTKIAYSSAFDISTPTLLETDSVVVVSAADRVIYGPDSVSIGSNMAFYSPLSGGTWSATMSDIATSYGSPVAASIDSFTGVLTGLDTGTITVTYTIAPSVYAYKTVRVYDGGAAVGSYTICATTTITLSDTGAGTWSSSNTSIATVGSTGVVTGVSAGTVIITHTHTSPYAVWGAIVTVNPMPVISGARDSMCVLDNDLSITASVPGGIWHADGTIVQLLDDGSVPTARDMGVLIGMGYLSYEVNGCTATKSIHVHGADITISAYYTLDVGDTMNIGTAIGFVGAEYWVSHDLSVAAAGWYTDHYKVIGVSPGTTIVGNYGGVGLDGSCYVTEEAQVTVVSSSSPGTITGPLVICLGNTVALADDGGGSGTWSSSNTAVAAIGSATGIVTAASAGTTVITYTITSGAYATAVLTVNTPGTLSFPSDTVTFYGLNVCILNDVVAVTSVSGGTWTMSSDALGISYTDTGAIFHAQQIGTDVITYTANGCTIQQTVNVQATPISATIFMDPLFTGAHATITPTSASGYWYSTNREVATVDSVTGVITAIASGGTVMYRCLPGCVTNDMVIIDVVASPYIGAITGTMAFCLGTTTALSDTSTGGTWSSSNTAVATVGSTGVVTSVSAGTARISYVLSASLYATAIVTVSASIPEVAILGLGRVCPGTGQFLSSETMGGIWSSADTSIATVDDGVVFTPEGSLALVSGVVPGTVTISYTVTNGCGTVTATKIETVNMLPAPGTVTGPSTVCAEGTITLTDTTGDLGVWSSSDTAVATVLGATGVVTGVAGGTATISYTVVSTYCGVASATKVITVNATADAGTISGSSSLLIGATTTLSDGISGGTWSSSNTSIATVGTSGVVTGIATGTATISYSVTASCGSASSLFIVTVSPLADAGPITGILSVCIGSTTALSDTSIGGTWSSDDTSIATINSGGVVTGVSPGMAYITYTIPGGAFAYTVVTVDGPATLAITGTADVCVGHTTTLSNSIGSLISSIWGEGWSSSDITIATVDSSTGTVTGVSAGTATISSYIVTVCGVVTATRIVTVNAASAGTITGAATVCTGSAITLDDAVTGGTWSSSNTAVATIGSGSGVVTGMAAGTATISYTVAGSCGTAVATYVVTVVALPDAGVITGAATLCVAATATLSETVTGGTWSSDNTSVATIGSTGVVSGVSPGTAIISYSVTSTCGTATATTTITVNGAPVAGSITGGSGVSVGSTLTLSDSVSGGTWSASNSHATVASDGTVTGVSFGSVIISYTLTNSCGTATAVKTINVTTSITGNLQVCAGSTTTLSNATSGGTWSSAASVAILTIIPSTGVVTGVAAGTGTVTYTLSGVSVTAVVTVNPLPPNISGATTVCLGTTTTLTDAASGGTWSSNNASIASADTATGVITGVATGSVTITYTLPTGCYKTQPMTVRPSPAAIGGPSSLCTGSVVTYTDATSGGLMWSSSNTSVATIGSISGVLTTHAAGTSVITYTLATGCIATKVLTVLAVPAGISGVSTMCPGATVTLTDAMSGGTWSSSATGIATVNATTGEVSGITAGVAEILYSVGGCTTGRYMTVNPLPAAITGVLALCTGSITSLGSSSAGGTWGSSATGVATVSSTGLVTATGTGNATITYTLPTGCARTAVVTVSAAPPITGPTTLCIGNPVIFTSSPSGGYWSSSNTAVASALISSGQVTGMAAGTANITYSLSAYCKASVTVTVGTSMAAISGPSMVCNGSSITLSDATSGGSWGSSNTSVATIGASTGIITSVSAGTTMISYSNGSGCYQTKIITVGSGLGSITGVTGLCVGAATTYLSTSPSTGLGWSSSNTSVATVGTLSGVVTGIAPGTATITFTPYAFSTYAGCIATKMVTVDAVPAVAAITGPSAVQVGHTITLADVTPGGVWSSNNTARATVSAGGVVTGVTVPSATISYTKTNGACAYSVTKMVLILTARPSAQEPQEAPQLMVYPNPTTGSFTVRTSQAGAFVIYTMDGKEVQHTTVSEGLNSFTLPKDLAAGIYMCRFNGNDGSSVMVRLVYE